MNINKFKNVKYKNLIKTINLRLIFNPLKFRLCKTLHLAMKESRRAKIKSYSQVIAHVKVSKPHVNL